MSKALGHLKSRVVATKADREPKKHTVTLVPGDTVGEELAESQTKYSPVTSASMGVQPRSESSGSTSMKRLPTFGTRNN